MKSSKGLLFFYDWREPFEELTGDECKTLLLAMLDYSCNGTEPPTFKGGAKIAASFIFPAIERSKERAESGSKGGSSRKLTSGCDEADSEQSSSSDEATVKQTSTTRLRLKQDKDETKTLTQNAERARASSEFELFWDAYPKQFGKEAALSEWLNAGITSEQLPAIIAAVKAQVTSDEWTRDNRRFVPMPANYIRGKRWLDTVIPAAQTDSGGSFDTDEFVRAAIAKSNREYA